MKHASLWIVGLLAAYPLTNTTAQVSEPSRITALRISESIRVDGDLTEAAWAQAQRITNFTQRELTEGDPVSERTEVSILYDEHSLYIGFWGYDRNPESLVARLMERDDVGVSLTHDDTALLDRGRLGLVQPVEHTRFRVDV